MKKYLFILIIALFSFKTFAQNTKFSVFVDPKFSWLKSDLTAVEGNGSKFGVNIGLNMDKFFAENYAITTGISIDNTGGNLKFSNSKTLTTGNGDEMLPTGSSVLYNLQYINVPLGLKLKTNEIGYLTFFTHLGLSGGVNIKAVGEVDNFTLENENISESIRLFDLGYFIGAGAEYSIGGNAAIIVGLTYKNGFIDITDDSDAINKITLSDFSIRIGVLF